MLLKDFKRLHDGSRRAQDAYKKLQDAAKSGSRAPKTAIRAILGRFWMDFVSKWKQLIQKSGLKSKSILKAKNQLSASPLAFFVVNFGLLGPVTSFIVREEGRGPYREAGKSGRGAGLPVPATAL